MSTAFQTYRGEDRIFLVAYYNKLITGQIIGPPTMTDQDAIIQLLDEHERVPLGHLSTGYTPSEWRGFIARSTIVRDPVVRPELIAQWERNTASGKLATTAPA